MQNDSHTIGQELRGIAIFIGAIWAVFLLSYFWPSLDSFGVVPRTLAGLLGIFAMPFLHANLGHIVANTVPLFVLLVLLAGSQARSWEIVVDIVLLGGFLLWLCGLPACNIGASGLIFGLIVFLLISGFVERRIVPLGASIAVAVLFGWTLLSGVLPRTHSNVSWDGHLTSAIAGGIVAYGWSRSRATPEATSKTLISEA